MARICNDKYRKLHYDKRITVEGKTRVADGAGGFTDTWANSHSAWSYIKPLTGNERWRAQQMATEVTHKIILKYQAGITTAHRVVFDSRVFNITEVINVEESNVILELMAVEGTAT